jgi:hypothetical protein
MVLDAHAAGTAFALGNGYPHRSFMTDRLHRSTRSIAVTLAALSTALIGGVGVAAEFDGVWSVVLTTESGACAQRRRVVVAVSEGRVTYAGEEQVTASGEVRPSGLVDVHFTYQGDRLDARGSVHRRIGSGSWSSPTMRCSGSWMARKQR